MYFKIFRIPFIIFFIMLCLYTLFSISNFTTNKNKNSESIFAERDKIDSLNKIYNYRPIVKLELDSLINPTLYFVIGKKTCSCYENLFFILKELEIKNLIVLIHKEQYYRYKILLKNIGFTYKVKPFYREDFSNIEYPYFFIATRNRQYNDFFVYDKNNLYKLNNYLQEIIDSYFL